MGKEFASIQTGRIPAPWQEVATALVKQFALHDGIWRVTLEFGPIGGMNAVLGQGQPVTPTAIVPVIGLSLKRVDVLDALSVDAAVVNPRAKAPTIEMVIQ